MSKHTLHPEARERAGGATVKQNLTVQKELAEASVVKESLTTHKDLPAHPATQGLHPTSRHRLCIVGQVLHYTNPFVYHRIATNHSVYRVFDFGIHNGAEQTPQAAPHTDGTPLGPQKRKA